jgi:hypothetical protein
LKAFELVGEVPVELLHQKVEVLKVIAHQTIVKNHLVCVWGESFRIVVGADLNDVPSVDRVWIRINPHKTREIRIEALLVPIETRCHGSIEV